MMRMIMKMMMKIMMRKIIKMKMNKKFKIVSNNSNKTVKNRMKFPHLNTSFKITQLNLLAIEIKI